MRDRGDDTIVVVEQRAPVEIGLELGRVGRRRDHKVEIPVAQHHLERVVAAPEHAQANAWPLGTERRDRLRQNGPFPGRPDAHTDVSGKSRPQPGDLLLRIAQRCSQIAGVAKHGLAINREAHAPRLAIEQHDPGLVLEAADGLGQRRLRHAQPLGCATQAALLGRGKEIVDGAEFHPDL